MVRRPHPLYFYFGLLFFSLVFLAGCEDELVSQNLRKVFVDGKVPKQLRVLQAQGRDISLKLKEKIIERVEADRERSDLLIVGVIDSGVDVYHPDLVPQLQYEVENGQIVAAGRDVMGDSAFASHAIVDPTLFAYGATFAKDGQIKGAPESPLRLILETDQYFSKKLLEEIAKSPILSKSHFRKLNQGNFTMFGLLKLILEPKVHLDTHKQAQANGKVVKSDEVEPSSEMTMSNYVRSKIIKPVWPLDTDSPDVELAKVEHFPVFLEIAIKVFNETDKKFSVRKNLLQVEDFSLKPGEIAHISADMQALKKVRNAAEFAKFGYHHEDPLQYLRRQIDKDHRLSGQSFKVAMQTFVKITKEKAELALKDSGVSKSSKKEIKKGLHKIEKVISVGEKLDELQNDPKKYQAFLSAYRRYYYRSIHPYIHKKTLENSHATHVAATIALQNPNIRIFPIRPVTELMKLSQSDSNKLVQEFYNNFTEWMKLPITKKIVEMISEEYQMRSISERRLLQEVRKYLKDNPLNLQFVHDVLQAIRIAGEQKLLLSNVSLGDLYEKQYKLNEKYASFAEDLFAEFTRYQMGNTIQKHAAGSLFVVATGNDGDWIDGVSKTTIPVGITSIRAWKIANELKIPHPPNNQVTNVLATGSISRGGTLTAFTNILIDPQVPQVFSVGEDVLASVPLRAEKRTGDLINKAMRPIQLVVNEIFSANEEIMGREGLSFDEQMGRQLFDGAPIFFPDVDGRLEVILSSQNPIGRERMSGTSMATPTVTGLVAKHIIQKIKSLGIQVKPDGVKRTQSEMRDLLYTHEGFKPNVIINEILEMAKAQRSNLGRTIQIDMLRQGIQEWKPSPNEKITRAEIKSLLATPLSCHEVTEKGVTKIRARRLSK